MSKHEKAYCSIQHLPAFTAWMMQQRFETVEMNEQDELFRLRRGMDLVCVMPRQKGKKFVVNMAQLSWLERFKKTLKLECFYCGGPHAKESCPDDLRKR